MLFTFYKTSVLFLVAIISTIAFGQGSQLPKYTVAQLPSASTYPSYIVQVTDGVSISDCSVGGATGSAAWNVFCVAHHGVWVSQVGSGGTSNSTSSSIGISSFTCTTCVYEIGQKVTNPSFTATYYGSPSSATLSDGTTTQSLVAPYTSSTFTGAYTLTTSGQKCFTITTVPQSTASSCVSWQPRQWGGISSSALASISGTTSGNNVVLSTGSILYSAGIAATSVGITFGPYNSTSPFYIYLLIQGCDHSDRSSFTAGGLSFPMTNLGAVTVNNQYAAGVSNYCLFRSTNQLGANSGAWNLVSVN